MQQAVVEAFNASTDDEVAAMLLTLRVWRLERQRWQASRELTKLNEVIDGLHVELKALKAKVAP
jgi:hypothetical protein